MDNSACGGDGTPPPTGGCGSPQWANDQWCDDENNNAACNWDGGACCDNDFAGYTQYCTACECLDPNAGGNPTTQGPTEGPTTQGPTSGPTTQGPTAAPPSPNSCGKIDFQEKKLSIKAMNYFKPHHFYVF